MRCVRSGRRESEVVTQSSTLACARVFDLIRASVQV